MMIHRYNDELGTLIHVVRTYIQRLILSNKVYISKDIGSITSTS